MEFWNRLTPEARSAIAAYVGLGLAMLGMLILIFLNSCLVRTSC